MISDHLHLHYVISGIDQVQSFIAGYGEPSSAAVVEAAVLHRIQRVAQSAMALSGGFKTRHPEVDWRGLRAFRDIAVRVDIDLEYVFHALEHSLPILRQAAAAEITRFTGETK